MALGNFFGGSSNEDGCCNTAMAATALAKIALVTLAISHFITHHVVANAIARVVAIANAFVSM
jgi:hypothetical protein